MSELAHEGAALGRIHALANVAKFHCHFTGFLEGVVASGAIEVGEVEPLIAECKEFAERILDADASDLIQDFEADLLEQETLLGAIEIREKSIDEACEKSALNRFLGFCRGVVCDGVITLDEASGIVARIQADQRISTTIGVNQILICCIDALEDGIVDSFESNEICDAIGAIVGDCYGDTGIAQTGGVANFGEAQLVEINSVFEGKIVVLTGSFKTKPRSGFEDELAAFGAIISKSITKKTDYLVIGGEAARDWIEMNRGTKIRKAQTQRLSGNKPDFLSEGQLLRLMKT